MKTSAFISALVLAPLAMGFGQEVSDPLTHLKLEDIKTKIDTSNVNLAGILADAGSLLQNARDQLAVLKQAFTDKDGMQQTLNDIKTSFGNPQDVDKGKFNDLRRYVDAWRDMDAFSKDPSPDDIPIPTGDQADGSKAFTATAGGLLPSVGKKFTALSPDKDGKTVTKDRSPELYQAPVIALGAVSDYYKLRSTTLDRKKDLQNLLYDTLAELRDAKDFATLDKYNALLSVIDGQLRACNDDINNGYNDAVMRGMQVFAMNQIKQTADNEPTTDDMKTKKETIDKSVSDWSSSNPANVPKPPTPPTPVTSALPWYRYGTKAP